MSSKTCSAGSMFIVNLLVDQLSISIRQTRLSLRELPHEQTSAGTGGAEPPTLDGNIAGRSRPPGVRVRKLRPRGADLFYLHSAVAVHNLSSRVGLFARTRCENHDASAPYPLNIRFGVCFEDPECREITNQVHFKISAWSTHKSTTRHLPRLAQNTNVLPREASGLEIANDLVGQS